MINRRFLSSLATIALLAITGAAGPLTKPASNPNSTVASGGQAFTLLSIKHEVDGPLTRILVESNAPPLYTVFRPTGQNIVIDLPGGDGSKLATEYPVKSSLVDYITVKSSASDGRSATRIVVNVKGSLKDRSALDGNTLVLELAPEGSAANVQRTAREPEPGVVVNAVAVADGKDGARTAAYVEPVSMRTENSGSKAEVLKPAKTVRSVRTEQNQGMLRVLVDTDGIADYKDFTLTNPSRIVVDLRGVKSEFGNKTFQVNQGPVERVRVGEPSSDTVRVVVDSHDQVPFRISREGASLVIAIGQQQSSAAPAVYKTPQVEIEPKPPVTSTTATTNVAKDHGVVVEPRSNSVSASRQNSNSPKTAAVQDSRKSETVPVDKVPANLIAKAADGPASSPAANRPATVKENRPPERSFTPVPIVSVSPAHKDAERLPAVQQQRTTPDRAFCDPGYVGGPISFDLRAGVDIRDMLRFISQQYGVNFIVDKSVSAVPVELRITDVPWNQVIDSVMRANRLGWVCENQGKIIRIATLAAVREEQIEQRTLLEEKAKAIPLETVIRHLKYARAAGTLAGSRSGGAGGASGGGGGMGGGSSSGGGASGAGVQGQTLLPIVTARLSPRGKVEVDARTNSIIITDLPDNIRIIQAMLDKLDRPEPQVEIEARIVVADRNFLRDLGVQLGAAVTQRRTNGALGVLETGPIIASNGGTITTNSGGAGGSSSSGSSSGSGGGSTSQNQIASNIPFAPAQNGLAAAANTVLGLTTGVFGTNIISAALSASETKGQIRTISTPRITAQDNQSAEIVNGVQIPVQTVSNNTVTTTFITAALRLQITPQIVEETGEVTMHVVAENNTVNTNLANQFNGGTPGINTQSAESIVRVKDGGTAVMGGINIDNESSTENRTPGLSKVPLLGELFKRRTTSKDSSEILFFITPRIVRSEGPATPAAGVGTERSSVSPAAKPGEKADDTSQPIGANGVSSVAVKTAGPGGSN
ncbi:MAG: type IV pilus secretin PilQ [Blastocatellia bacterium]